ncbi:MAG: ATP-dependent helicase HrpB [Bacteroidales bacterium]|nr:ATP-dependent helicase HrpB [Bacteroidales bacterium]
MDQATNDEIIRQLADRTRLVVTAPPGAGKSTQLPLALLDAVRCGKFDTSGKILMLEPRRLAARQIAERMAELLDEPVGRTIGYRIRFETKTSAATRLEVLTEGILTRMLVADPTLDGVAMVLFDEFHERSLTSDVALALTREAQNVIRPDLRIVLMSATIDTKSICTALDAPVVESTGRMFPVELRRTDEELVPLIRRAHREHEGDILVFLPGEAEIRRCAEALADTLAPTRICPLYGMLSSQEQRAAIAPSRAGERKIVLSTPIAETSLTIQGVRVVIDSGLCRRLIFNPQNSLSHLQTVPISMDMATQRMGRAGRVAPGTCYRMWSLADEHRMADCRTPEILEADLCSMVLDIAAWGTADVASLPWLTPPPAAHVAQAQQLLRLLGALDDDGKITPHGRQLAALPCHPRVAQMLVSARSADESRLACQLAAILEERDPLANVQHDADIRTRLDRMTRRMRQMADQYAMWIKPATSYTKQTPSAGYLIAQAYPERIAKAEPEGCGRFRLANGEKAFVDAQDELSAHEWLAVASMNAQSGGGRIFLAAPIEPDELKPMLRSKESATWDTKRGCIVAQREWRIGSLIVRTEPLRDFNAAQLIAEAARKDGRSMLDFNDRVQNLQQRIATLADWHPELGLPDLSTDAVLAKAPDWLPLYIGKATTSAELKKIDLYTALWGLLSYEQQQEAERLVPSHIAVPTGNRIRVEYRIGAELPVLRVRLQECFGMADTPRVDGGRRPVLMELLSPGFKPVQLTQDLRNFWQETYFEVRKELRRRYPKHAWPDNPLEATAVRGARKRE